MPLSESESGCLLPGFWRSRIALPPSPSCRSPSPPRLQGGRKRLPNKGSCFALPGSTPSRAPVAASCFRVVTPYLSIPLPGEKGPNPATMVALCNSTTGDFLQAWATLKTTRSSNSAYSKKGKEGDFKKLVTANEIIYVWESREDYNKIAKGLASGASVEEVAEGSGGACVKAFYCGMSSLKPMYAEMQRVVGEKGVVEKEGKKRKGEKEGGEGKRRKGEE